MRNNQTELTLFTFLLSSWHLPSPFSICFEEKMEKRFLTVAETGSASLKPTLPSSLVTESLDSWEQTLVQVRMG